MAALAAVAPTEKPASVVQVLADLGAIQLDTISVLARSFPPLLVGLMQRQLLCDLWFRRTQSRNWTKNSSDFE